MPTIRHLALSWRWNCSDSQNCGFVTVCYWRFLHLRCFDQQFANFFTSFFATGEQGTRVFGYVTTMGELLNASIMFFAPLIINRIGGKKCPAAGWHYYVCTYYWLIVRHLSAGSGYSENAAYVWKYRSCWWAALNILPASLKCVFQRRFIWSVSASLSNWR